ncbi:hypothetical protein [Cohnella nanjingensis]|uniref:Thioredoxin domain-containing protein n=1 Tax=Cohnella nanjingensis TaxID=1387779 RepID=A0A7X0VGA7_9BACL|nr:hypothetical protein [Cohnella nanjingensis]MBB6672907.1 hypothetical protein [Cohnella nanjingensis]
MKKMFQGPPSTDDIIPKPAGDETIPSTAGRTALVFASMHCLDCIDLLPHLASAARAMPEYSFRLFTTGDEADNREMADYFGWTFPVIALAQEEMGRRYAISALPYAILTDDEGRVAAAGTAHDEAELVALRDGIRTKGGEAYGMRMSAGNVP